MAYKCRTLNIQEKESPFVWISMDDHKYHLVLFSRPHWWPLPSRCYDLRTLLFVRIIISHHTSLPHPSSIHLDNDGSTFHPILHLKRDNTQVLLALGSLELNWCCRSHVCVCCSWCYINFGLGGLKFVLISFFCFLYLSTFSPHVNCCWRYTRITLLF